MRHRWILWMVLSLAICSTYSVRHITTVASAQSDNPLDHWAYPGGEAHGESHSKGSSLGDTWSRGYLTTDPFAKVAEYYDKRDIGSPGSRRHSRTTDPSRDTVKMNFYHTRTENHNYQIAISRGKDEEYTYINMFAETR